jgi:hypothetical protein
LVALGNPPRRVRPALVVAGLASRQLGAHSELGLVQALGVHLVRLRAGRLVHKRQVSALLRLAARVARALAHRPLPVALGHKQPLREVLLVLVLQLQIIPVGLVRAVSGRRKRVRGKEPSHSNGRKP